MTEQWGNYNPPGQDHPFAHSDDPALEDWPDTAENPDPDLDPAGNPDDTETPDAEHDPSHDDEG